MLIINFKKDRYRLSAELARSRAPASSPRCQPMTSSGPATSHRSTSSEDRVPACSKMREPGKQVLLSLADDSDELQYRRN